METATIVAVAVSHIKIILALTGIEPVLSALRGPRVNQLHHSAPMRRIIKSEGCDSKRGFYNVSLLFQLLIIELIPARVIVEDFIKPKILFEVEF